MNEMETRNLRRILKDCLEYGDEPQTFSRRIVLAAIAELDALEAAQPAGEPCPVCGRVDDNHMQDVKHSR